ncbi:MAG: TolC family protein [Candidatus Limisoma sp.]
MMKNGFLVGIAIAAMVSVPMGVKAQADSTSMLSLPKAIEIALSESPTVKVANNEITKQEYGRKGTLASLFPQIDFGADYSRTIKKQVMYMSGSMPGMSGSTEGEGESGESEASSKANAGIAVGRNNTWSLGFSASLPVIAPQLWKQLSITADQVELAVEQSRESKIKLISNVRQAYYTVMLAKDSYNVYKETYQNTLDNYTDIKQKFDQGLVSEYDLIRADVAVKNVEPSLFDAQNAVVLAKWQLKALMGIDLNADIDCRESLGDYADRLEEVYMQIDTTALSSNSTMRQLAMQATMLRKAKEAAQAAYYPTLGVAFSYKWNAMSEDFKFKDYRWDPYAMIGVSLSIPIFSGGKRYNSLRQAKVDMANLELTRFDTERNLMVALKSYTDQMKTSIRSHNAAEQGVMQARKGYDIAKKRYDTGAGTLLEINDSRLSLTQAQLQSNQAVYNFLKAKASLDETLGKDETTINE